MNTNPLKKISHGVAFLVPFFLIWGCATTNTATTSLENDDSYYSSSDVEAAKGASIKNQLAAERDALQTQKAAENTDYVNPNFKASGNNTNTYNQNQNNNFSNQNGNWNSNGFYNSGYPGMYPAFSMSPALGFGYGNFGNSLYSSYGMFYPSYGFSYPGWSSSFGYYSSWNDPYRSFGNPYAQPYYGNSFYDPFWGSPYGNYGGFGGYPMGYGYGMNYGYGNSFWNNSYQTPWNNNQNNEEPTRKGLVKTNMPMTNMSGGPSGSPQGGLSGGRQNPNGNQGGRQAVNPGTYPGNQPSGQTGSAPTNWNQGSGRNQASQNNSVPEPQVPSANTGTNQQAPSSSFWRNSETDPFQSSGSGSRSTSWGSNSGSSGGNAPSGNSGGRSGGGAPTGGRRR